MISDSVDIINNIVCFSKFDRLTGYYVCEFTEKEIQTLDKLGMFLKTWEDIHNNLILLKEMKENDK